MFDQDLNDAPTVTKLWNRAHTAKKGGRLCGCCKEEVKPGERYESWGHIVDGQFEQAFHHYAAYQYPSGCPSIGRVERAEAEAQFAKDQALFNGVAAR